MIEKKAFEMTDELISVRRQLHKTPETDFEEVKTAEFIRKKLKEYGIEYTVSAKTGTVALIKGKNTEKTVLLRADIDGLPIKDESDFEIKSERDGYMHACGHDIHATCLLGAAKILNDMKDELNGNVKLVFQPAEEGIGGALPMIKDGVLENPHVDGAFALHVEPLEKTGNIRIKNGSMMASPDDFKIIVHGKGGHASAPESCINPVTIGAEIVKALDNLNETVLKDKPCVMTVCYFNGGTCNNAIPQTAEIMGTARSLDNETREMLAGVIEETAYKTAEGLGTTVDFTFNKLFPPVVNNTEMNEIVIKSAEKLECIKEIVTLDKPAMAGDDFAYFTERVMGTYFRLGVGNAEKGAVYPIHSPKFIADEAAIPVGAALLAQSAVEFLDAFRA